MNKDKRFDPEIKNLIPHREPMLLINKIGHVDEKTSSAYVYIDEDVSFYEKEKNGVAAWVGLEYMGQTAALMGGYRLREGLVEPHLGILLGTRKYTTETDCFIKGKTLYVSCKEQDMLDDNFAKFNCTISYDGEEAILATATLSIFRQLKVSNE